MLHYAVRSVPRAAFALTIVALVGWFWLLNTWPSYLWLAAGIAAGLLGAGVSRLFDEPAAAVVDTLPRALWWRTAARSWTMALLLIGWLVGVATVGADQPGVRVDLLRQYGVGAALAAAALCTLLRRRGYVAPGALVGSVFLLVSLFLSVNNPVPQLVPVFPLAVDPEVPSSRRLWLGIALVSAAALIATCWEGKRRLRLGPTRNTAT